MRSRSTATPSWRPRTANGSRSWRSTDGGASSTTCIPTRCARRLHKRAARAAGTTENAVTKSSEGGRVAERLNVGVAARLSRYLQVLTQARKMGKTRISSQEIAEYTNINATQIRRDLSNFGKFGKRGVGYSIELLLDAI